MSASKKRRANETYEEDIRDASTSPRLWKRASRTGSPNMKGARPSLFESNKLSLWQQHVEHLNEDTKRKVLDCSNSVDTFFTVCKHLRVQKDIDDLYHRTPGEVVAMGNDDCLQLGVSPQIINEDEEKPTEYKPTLARHMPSNVIQVAAGGLHSAALTNDGKVYTWGCNDDYALGREVTDENLHLAMQMPQTSFLPEDQGEIVAIDAGDSHTLFLSLNGNVYQTGMYKDMDSGKFRDLPPGETNPKGINKVPVKVDMPQKVRAIAAGFSWNAAILADNSIVTWGMGHHGQLARSQDMGAPITKGPDGKDTYELGKRWIGTEVEAEEKDEKTGKIEKFTVFKYFGGLIAEKFLKPAPPRWTIPGKKDVISVACGSTHLLVVAVEVGEFDSAVYSSGHNQYGQLGHGDNKQRHELSPIKTFKGKHISRVAAGEFHSLALNLQGNAVFSWGRSDYGQLGLSWETDGAGGMETSPKQVTFPDTVGDMRISEIGAGAAISFAIFVNKDVYTWGFNETAATGQTGGKDILRPKKLNVLKHYASSGAPTKCHVENVAGGGQHTLMVINRGY